jgi:trimeric autotransporter adhesin
MFKNTTRRGLALGAAISLVVTGLVSTPAQAAGEVVFAPTAGTSYNTFVTEDFTLQASLAPGQNSAQATQLKYKIEKAAGVTVSYGVSTSASVGTSLATVSSTVTSAYVAADGAGALTQNFIKLAINGATSVSATANVTVTAFIDANNNNTLDSGEFATARTVSFKKYADVAAVVTMTQPAEGDTSVKTQAAFTDINMDQVASGQTTVVTSFGGTASGSASVVAASASQAVDALAGAVTVSSVVKFRGEQVGAASATLTVTAKAVKSVTASAVVGVNAINASAGNVTARVDSAFVVKATALNGTTSTASGVAGVAVTVEVTTNATLTSTQSITLNGTVYTDSAKLPTALAVTADAAGVASVNVATAGIAAGQTVTFAFKSQNTVANNLVATLAAAAYTAKSTGVNNFRTVATSSAFVIDYTVADQWKVALPAGYRLVVAYDGTTKYVPVSAGAAQVSFTSTASATTLNVTNPDLEKQNTTTLNWSTVSATTASAVAVKSTTVAAKFITAPTHSATASVSRVVSASPGLNNLVTLSGTVNHAGDAVTITGAGVKFSSATDAVSVGDIGDITVNADGDGHFTVSAYVHTAGTANLTYAVGAATATTSLKVDAAAANEGKEISIVVVSGDTAAAGSTVRAKVVVKDEYGNPVAATATQLFGVTVAGPGFVGTLPTTTGANGESAEFSILLGSGDTAGTVTITATYDADGATTTIAPITVVKAVTIGAVAAAVDQKLTVGSFKGFVAIYTKNYTGSKLSAKVAGKWLTVNNLSSFSRTVRLTGAGYTIKVDLYIDGKFVRSETVVTK